MLAWQAFPGNCNTGMVELERVQTAEEAAALKSYLVDHFAKTGSSVAQLLLECWPQPLQQFVKVMPTDFKRVLAQQAMEGDVEAQAFVG